MTVSESHWENPGLVLSGRLNESAELLGYLTFSYFGWLHTALWRLFGGIILGTRLI